MPIEHEIKILDINIDIIRNKLKVLWAKFINTKSFRRYVYEMKPPVYEKRIRLRTDWTQTTLTVKHIINPEVIDGTKEREIIVDNFDTTNTLLNQMWYVAKSYQENNRESYHLDECDIEIDSRPHIPPYLEIEWPSVNAVQAIVNKIWLSNHIHTSENTTDVYARYGINNLEKTYPLLQFQ
mgnify:CR=1 FL=1